MSVFFPVSEFFENSGNQAARFNEDLRDGIVSAACSFWNAYPSYFTKSTSPINSFARGYLNQVCSVVQPAPPPPTVPFTGGQCCDKEYDVNYTWAFRRCFQNQELSGGTETVRVAGRIIGIEMAQSGSFVVVTILAEDCDGNSANRGVKSTGGTLSDTACFTTDPFDPRASWISRPASTFVINSVATADGSPDDCGSLPPEYPISDPSPGDLTTTINVTNIDGVDNSYTLTWNQVDNSYNFPMNFKLNGINVTLDLSGLTIHNNLSIVSINTGNSSPPPGSDGGKDEEGNDYVQPFTVSEYAAFPDNNLDQPIESPIEFLLCESGIIETITEVIKITPGVNPIFLVVLDLLSAILAEVCGSNDISLGFPEVYPVLPGVERPAILYYWKEFDGETPLPSTYTSTVSNPTQSAIAEIETIVVPDKAMGKYVVALKLLDGSRVVSSGLDESLAIANHQFLLNQVEPSLIPSNVPNERSITQREKLQEKVVKCTQIEYYPFGRSSGVSPAILRIINPFPPGG